MTGAQDLLQEPEIAEYLVNHQGAAAGIQSAAEHLANKTDAVTALKKLFPALTEKVIFVFFSYKKKDERTAKSIVDILEKLSAARFKITYQAGFTEELAGKPWREKIRRSVREANWFILLLPDPSDEWDWCLFETGLFEAQQSSADRLICLHHPDINIPSPIEGYHAVAATVPEVEKFLRMAFINKDPVYGMQPVNPTIESNITEHAKKIVDAIRPPIKNSVRQVFEPWVELIVPNAKELTGPDDLDKSKVVSANKAALEIFDYFQQPETWKELRKYIIETAGDNRWRSDLFHVIRKIANGRNFTPIQAFLRTPKERFFRPVACAIDRIGENGPIDTFHITFTEEVSAVDLSMMPLEISTLATILRLAFRFRWEVLEKFTKQQMSEKDVERLDNSMNRIMIDADSRGITDPDMILTLFPSEQKKRIDDMFTSWYEARNENKTGTLDIAIKEKNIETIQEILSDLARMNQEFLEIASDRFASIVSR